jgi:hypothetical protein
MLASDPASILNDIRPKPGILSDSEKLSHALAKYAATTDGFHPAISASECLFHHARNSTARKSMKVRTAGDSPRREGKTACTIPLGRVQFGRMISSAPDAI